MKISKIETSGKRINKLYLFYDIHTLTLVFSTIFCEKQRYFNSDLLGLKKY